MEIKKFYNVFFSPTDSTRKVTEFFLESLVGTKENVDVTSNQLLNKEYEFKGDDFVVWAVPVYGGRVPVPAIETFKKMHGRQTPLVLIVTYGNREYDDALVELRDIAFANGFVLIAAGAFICEHSIMHSVAKGRPDELDVEKIKAFSLQVQEKIKIITNVSLLTQLKIKGNYPYREYKGIPLKPQANKNCNQCGLCANSCPTKAIPDDSPNVTNKELCISCMHCVKYCPNHARQLNKVMLAVAEKAFYKKNKQRKEPEIFL